MSCFIDVCGNNYPVAHASYGVHMQELFFYTSRYYAYTEKFLQQLSGDRGFSMNGYQARKLSPLQRRTMAGLLSLKPDAEPLRDLLDLIHHVAAGSSTVPEYLLHYETRGVCRLQHRPRSRAGAKRNRRNVPVLDPLLSLLRRQRIPARLNGRVLRVSFPLLARLLDSPNPTVRRNTQEAILYLHRGGAHVGHLDGNRQSH